MSWEKGATHEKRVLKLIETGEYDGKNYHCLRMPKHRFFTQDVFGHDIICVNSTNWLLCQVKYLKSRKPPKRKTTIDRMLEIPMPDNTKRVLARIDGYSQNIYWDEF